MKTIFKHTLLSLALLAGVFTAQAQVKIGSSPTTIGANSNLEVQAVNGKKVIVDKAVGTVQVENLPPGAATNKIVTADPTGVLQQIDAQTLPGSKFSKMHGGVQAIGSLPNGVLIDFQTSDVDQLGGVDLATNRFNILETGWYTISARQTAGAVSWGGSHYDIAFWKNGVSYFDYANALSHGDVFYSQIYQFNAGDYIEFKFDRCGGCASGDDANWSISRTDVTIEKR